ncbi:hypothetical protein SAMN05444156_0935 [Verrucomicrobium sp. GAS474]|uniref:hypothetical protein n=1 Tax=Verrucomicrobium sp. GAS474 TaxID=1882831 RepID=UPI00087A7976|nr:hypothetical protein [Verrucomicrobium sp. GAS474]SDT94212.1 hypothetical protein SAMN05444156_0935 [Verrucomicrobium sp. GAS474]
MKTRAKWIGFLRLSLALCLGPAGSEAQEFQGKTVREGGDAPSIPFTAPETLAYTVRFSYSQPLAAPSTPEEKAAFDFMQSHDPRIKELRVEKSGELRHDSRIWNEEKSFRDEVWYVGTERFQNMGDAVGIRASPASGDARKPFPEIAWIGKSTFFGTIGTTPAERVDVYRMQFDGAPSGFDPFQFMGEEVTVYIGNASGLPLGIKTSRYTATYTYHTAPASLDLPGEFRQAVATYQDRAKKAALPP